MAAEHRLNDETRVAATESCSSPLYNHRVEHNSNRSKVNKHRYIPIQRQIVTKKKEQVILLFGGTPTASIQRHGGLNVIIWVGESSGSCGGGGGEVVNTYRAFAV